MIRRVLVAGGGTGGHLFPGLAVVEELRRRFPGVKVHFAGTERGIEARVLPERGEELTCLEVTPLKGQGLSTRLASFVRIPGAMGEAASLIRRFSPDLVLGVGGYAAGPVLLCAALSGRPTALLEQNAYVGLTNRILSRFVDRAYVSFEQTLALFGESKALLTGNPVRREFVELSQRALADPEGFESRARTILVLGGSQGARKLNEIVPAGLARARLAERGLRVVHQTGKSMRAEVEARYRELGVEAEVVTFIDDVARAYANASLVIARAGATTLAELCAIGRAAILVPYRFAADDHQRKNAEALEAQGAAICMQEASLSADGLAQRVNRLLDEPAERQAMALAARAHGRPDAAAAIVDDLLDWLDGTSPKGEGPLPNDGSASPGDSGRSCAAPMLRFDRDAFALRMAPPRVRRPLVVDGAVWE
jgi:UDP-N-acetylglucosamine--N-acetylmuramyl-(pentapeptide) pyrophosphoryl-undecaprenol N-acetylglucosamine transferase